MMIKHKLIGRIKAAVVSAALVATTFVTPAVTTFSSVSAATINVNHTFTTSADEDSTTRKANISLTGVGDASTITLNFTTSYSGSATIEAYGWGYNEAPYWENDSQKKQLNVSDGKCSVTFTVPTALKGKVKEVGVGVWYPQSGEKFTLTTIETDSAGGTDNPGGETDIPGSQFPVNGCSFVDNKDGTATISSTLTAEIEGEFDYPLTLGYDEDYYDAKLNPDLTEEELAAFEAGTAPINSHKFRFSEFGIDDMTNVTLRSFRYVIQSETELEQLQYGGGINVEVGSPADTEQVKGKDGYWYNDQGTFDEEALAEFEAAYAEAHPDDALDDIKKGGYEALNAGTYAEITWDVPEGVQQYVTMDESSTVSLQYWYGSNGSDPETYEPYQVESVNLTGASCTYVRTMTVPYNKTISQTPNKTLTSGSDTTNQVKFSIPDLKLGDRDKISAIKFTVTSTSDLHKLTTGVGISVSEDNEMADKGWYQPSNLVVLDGGKTAEIMWILPETIRDDVYKENGEILFGFWYGGDTAGTEVSSVTLKSVDFYTYVSQEEELTVTPSELELVVGDETDLTVNVDGCTFISTNKNAVTVDSKGHVNAIAVGTGTIVVTTPENQEVVINFTVSKAAVTTAVTTTAVTTTTTAKTTATTAVSTEEPIDWDRVLYGDVNLDEEVNSADIVILNKRVLSLTKYPLVNATAEENANCADYDAKEIDSKDSMAIINYVLKICTKDDLGPAKKPANKFYS